MWYCLSAVLGKGPAREAENRREPGGGALHSLASGSRIDPQSSLTRRVTADDTSHRQPATASPGDVRTLISDGLVALLKEYYGRGPEQAKTYVHDDLVVCLLRGGFTAVEQTLLEGGHSETVIRQRMAFQDVMRTRFERVVEKATGRRVVGFMSGNQQDPDMICEVFVLAENDVAR